MNKISYCPKCGSYLNYDSDSNEWYCSGILPNGAPDNTTKHICNYTEVDGFVFKTKFRKGVDE